MKHAFPSENNPSTGITEYGLTIRDYFAAKAMQALINSSMTNLSLNSINIEKEPFKESIAILSQIRTLEKEFISKHAYEFADRMIEVKEDE